MIFDKSTVIVASIDFKSGTTYVDPTAVRFKFKKPGAAAVTYVHGTDAQLVKDEVGKYHVDLTLDTAGTWRWRFEGDGPGAVTKQGQFTVPASYFE